MEGMKLDGRFDNRVGIGVGGKVGFGEVERSEKLILLLLLFIQLHRINNTKHQSWNHVKNYQQTHQFKDKPLIPDPPFLLIIYN